MTPCKLNAGSCAAQFDYVKPSGEGIVRMCQNEAVFCPYREVAPTSDLAQLRTLLTKAGVSFRSWNVNEFIMKDGTQVVAEGIVLVHGSMEDGPYTEYLFDRAGNILRNGVTSYYIYGLDVLESA